MTSVGEAFWSFSLSFYDLPGVSAACITLQDEHSRDVNLVLYACWVGLSGRGRLAGADVVHAAAANDPWRQHVIAKLRAARRAVKEQAPEATSFYAAAKAVELEAERLAQHRLAALAPPAAGAAIDRRRGDAAANLSLYLEPAPQRATAAAIFSAIAAWEE